MQLESSRSKRGATMRCHLVVGWLLVLVVAIASATQQTTDPSIVAWASATGGALHIQWAISASWSANNSLDDVEDLQVFVDGQLKETMDTDAIRYDLYGLTNNTVYNIQVKATLVNTSSAPPLYAAVVAATTSNRVAPGTPDAPAQLFVSGGFVQVSVKQPPDTGGVDLVSVTIVIRHNGSFNEVQRQSLSPDKVGLLTYNIYGLDAQTTYWISAFAVNEGGLSSQESEYLEATTMTLQLPDPCPSPEVLNTTGASVFLQLIPPLDDGGGRIQGYNVYMATNDVGVFTEVVSTVGTDTVNVVEILRSSVLEDKPLLPETRYIFKAVAVNLANICISVPSSLQLAKATSAWTTTATVPGTPPRPYFLRATGGMITMSLIKPLNMRGANLTGFSITVSDTSGNQLTTSTTSDDEAAYDATSLTTNSNYLVSAAVITNLGTSLYSTPITMSTTAPSTPTAPWNITIANITGSSAILAWSVPRDTGGVDVTGYIIRLISLGSQEDRGALSYPILLNNLVADTLYTVKVSVTNAAGKSSPRSLGTTFKTQSSIAPSAPWAVLSPFASGGAIEVAWNPPEDRGGELLSLMSYKVTAWAASSCFTNEPSSSCSGCNSVKISGDKYQLIESGSVCAEPTTQCPDTTLECCLTRADSEFGYGFSCGRMSPANDPRVVVGTTSAIVNGLNSSSTYYFGVQAINRAGKSAVSSLQRQHTTTQTSPSHPSNLRQLTATGGSIQLTWDAPRDTGGGLIVGYRVYRNYELLTPRYISPPYTDCGGLVADTAYAYGVVAVNASLVEGAMASTKLSTSSLSAPLPPSLSFTGITYNRLQLSVTPPCDTGGDAESIYRYIVKYEGGVVRSGNFGCCDFVLEGLKANQSYVVLVQVETSVALPSSWVEVTYQTTSGVPPAFAATLLQVNTYSAIVALGSAPTNNDTSSYDIYLRQDSIEIQNHTIACKQAVDLRSVCPKSFELDTLEHETEYEISVRANGPLGSTTSHSVRFNTSGITVGTFGMSKTDYYAENDGVISAMVVRSNGASGSVVVGMNVTEPDTVLLRCKTVTGGGCHCALYLSSSGAVSETCHLAFVDGQDSANVTFSIWNNESAELLPSQVVVQPFGVTLSDQHAALLHTDPHQDSGFASFSVGPSEVFEDVSFAMVNVVRLNGTTGKITFGFESFDITAVSGGDYVGVSGTGVLVDHQSSTQIWIQVIDNYFINGDKTFGLRLTGQSVISNRDYLMTHKVTIRDDESVLNAAPRIIDSLSVTYTTGGEFEVEWTVAVDDAAPVSGYLVHVSAASKDTFSSVYSTTVPLFTLSGLSARSLYYLKVAARNAFGVGEFSNSIEVVTKDATPPSPPLLVKATDVTNTHFVLSWETPQDDGGNAIVKYRVSVVDPDGNLQLSESIDASQMVFVVSDLYASSDYVCYVSSTTSAFPDNLSVASTAQITVSTAVGVSPGPPPAAALLGHPRGGTLAFLMQRPEDTGGMPLTNCVLYLRKVADVDSTTDAEFSPACDIDLSDSVNPSCTITNLLASSSYEVYSVFSNAKGIGQPGECKSVQTSGAIDLPSPPLNLRAPSVTAGNILLEWDAPADLGGASDVVGYVLYQKFNIRNDKYFTLYDGQDSKERKFLLRGMTRDWTYAFAVVALNEASFCAAPELHNMSSFWEVSTLAYSRLTPPAQPYLVNATGGSITIGWDVPDDLAGVELQAYSVEVLNSISNEFEVLPGSLSPYDTTYTHYGLSESASFCYAVSAFNQDGPSERSTTFTASTTIVSQPWYVQNFRTIAASGGSVTLSWDPPQDTGGRSIQRYEIARGGRSGTFYTTDISFTDRSGLSALTRYFYTITAFNGVYNGYGASVWSETGSPSFPDPPTFNVVPFGGQLEVSWVEPEYTGGIPIIDFEITLLSGDQLTTIQIVTTKDLSYMFKGLVANTAYQLTGTAQNDLGASHLVEFEVETGPVDAPGAPPHPVASNIRGGGVDVHVEKPVYTGGGNVTLRLYKDGVSVHDFAVDEWDVTIYGLVAETDYAFWVAAKNLIGETKGNTLTVTTSTISTPGQVQHVAKVSVTFSQMMLSWDIVVNTGGDEHLHYQVTYFRCNSDGVQQDAEQVQRADSNTIVIEELHYSSFYTVTVAAITSTSLLGDSSAPIQVAMGQPLQGVIVASSVDMIVNENVGVVSVPISRVNGSYGNVSYSFDTLDDSALDGENYLHSSGTRTLTSNLQFDFVDIPIINDTVYNHGITFKLIVMDSDTGLQSTTTIYLEDDGDAGFISFFEPTLMILESHGTAYINITRTGGSSPRAVIQPVVVQKESSMDRFHVLDSIVVFEEGETLKTLSVVIIDDSEFQYVADSITLGFKIVSGGVLFGAYTSTTVTAVNDGDISLPKLCLNLRRTSATGGSFGLQWTPPIDHGGADITLSYVVSIVRSTQVVMTLDSPMETATVYGLNQSTSYSISVQAANPRGAGLASTALLLSTLAATAPTAPRNIQMTSASSSSVHICWDAPLDTGGAPIVSYTIFKISGTNTRSLFSSVSCSAPTLCVIDQLLALTSYSIQIQASTAFASQGVLSDVIVLTTSSPTYPEMPPIAAVTWASAGAMKVEMFNPVNVGGSNIEEYRLFIRADDDASFTWVYAGTSCEHTIYRLRYDTLYHIKYQVVNSVGPSSDSPIKSNQTLSKSLPSEPIDVKVVETTGGAIKLAWTEPLDIGGRQISGYTIAIVSIDGSPASAVGYDGKSIPAQEGIVYDLTADTQYGMQVVAYLEVSNCFDTSLQAWSSVIHVSTSQATAPRTAPELLVGRFTGGVIELVWVLPKDKGGVPLAGYTINLLGVTGAWNVVFSTSNASAYSFVHNDRTASTSYSYTITTLNVAGNSPTSSVFVATTDIITLPSAPLNARQLAYTTGGAITIGWDRAVDTGGQPIAGYAVYRNSELASGTLSAATRNFTDTAHLLASTSYNYTVRTIAHNAMVSMASEECPAKSAPATKPQKAWSLSAISGSSYLNVSWIPDGDTGGMPITAYKVQLMLDSTLLKSNTGMKPDYLFTGLTASTIYSVSIKVYNAIGASEAVVIPITTTSLAVPSSPNRPLVVSIFGGNFTIQVEPPQLTGGSPIASMNVYQYTGNVATLKTTLKVVAGVATSYNFFGLTESSDYVVACSAVNSAGEGPLSDSVTTRTTSLNPPGPVVMAPVLSGATGTTLSFAWFPPVDTGGSLDLSYDIRVVSSIMDAINPTVNLFYTVKDLAYSSLYSISVRAVNKNGVGVWSPVRTAMTQPDAAGEFSFAQTSASVLEDATQVALTVQRVSGLSGQITLTYTTELTGTRSATVGSDYAVTKGSSSATGSIVFEPLQSQKSIVILILNDEEYESPDETFNVRLTSATSASGGRPKIGISNVATVTIVDEGDAGFLSFETPSYSFMEDGRTGTVSIIREYGKSGFIALAFEFWGGTAIADLDYRKVAAPVVMENGVTKATLTFTIVNDNIFEFPDEFFFIRMTVSSGGAKLRQPLTRVTILDDGDVSDPGTCPPPELLSRTGGSAAFATDYPTHNGSANGALINYVVRLSTDTSSLDFKKPVAPTFSIGGLTATTAYSVAIAATTAFGEGTFSSVTQFSTTAPTPPGTIASVSVESKTGGRISLSWPAPDDTGGIPISKYRIYMVDTFDTPQITAENTQPITRATVYGLTASTAYVFSVQAVNIIDGSDAWGDMSAPFKCATTAPTQPGPLILHSDPYKNATGGKVFPGWRAPLDTGGINISSYNIFARSPYRAWFLAAKVFPDTEPLFAGVARLNASTAYEMFVLAENPVTSVGLPGKMSIAEGTRVMRTTVDLSSWLSVGTVISIQDAWFVVVNISSAATGSILLKYALSSTSIVSQSGSILGQATSFSALSTSNPTLPDTPPAPTLSIATGGMINMTLLSPEDTGGIPILDFSLYWNGEKLDEDSYDKTISKANYLQIRAFVSVPRLESSTSYDLSAVALNSLSLCYFGRAMTGPNGTFFTTKVTAPGTPQVVVSRATGGGITMNVIDPHDTGGKDIGLYRLYYKRNGSVDPWQLSYIGPKHQATVARLKSLTDYAFLTSVNNGFFDSVNSSVKVAKTTNKSPPGPCEPASLVNSTGGMLKVAWDYPADDGGSEVTGFYATIASSLDGSGRMTVKTKTPSCVFYRLLTQSSYDIVIRANNSYGLGPESPIATFMTDAATSPEGEIDVTVQITTGGAAVISFDEPIDLGGALPSEMIYNVYLDRVSFLNISNSILEDTTYGTSARILSELTHRRLETATTFSNIIVGGMDPETLYGIQIRPISRYASGGLSASFAVETTSPTRPSAPIDLSVDGVTGGSVSLSWGEPVDSGGIPLNSYSLRMSTVEVGPYGEAYNDILMRTTLNKLKPGKVYWVYVVGLNDVGESPSSNIQTFSTRSITPPSAPRNLSILSVGFDSIDCAWNIPDDTGGDSIGSYIITMTSVNNPTASTTLTTSVPYAAFILLSPSTTYSISVRALNTLGDASLPSLTRYTSTSSGIDTPSTPQAGCVSQDSVELFWYPYPGATEYHVFRDGTDIFYTVSSTSATDSTFSAGTTYSYTVRVKISSRFGPESLPVTIITPDASSTDALCEGNMGHIHELSYDNNIKKRWRIEPANVHSYINLEFITFALECDHDYVEILDALTEERLWKGGCVRKGRFVYQAQGSVTVVFTSDASITQEGFEMHFQVDGDAESTRIPPPGDGTACSRHGRIQSDGTCKCSVGFTGEGCNNRIVCCSNPQRCHHAACDVDPAKIIVVSGEFGNDEHGTGQMMDASETGTASKAVKTISRAVELSTEGSAILLYPGAYAGWLNRDLTILSTNITITTLKGPFWTSVDCEELSRFASIGASIVVVEGLTIRHCRADNGGVFNLAEGDFSGIDILMTDGSASMNGGAIYATGSNVSLSQVSIVTSTAGNEGGALYCEESKVSMIASNVTKSTSIRGGAVALRGTSSLSTVDTEFVNNVASASGGGAFVNGVISLKGVSLVNNKARDGGGLAMDNAKVTMESCVCADNTAENAGGGLALSGATTLVITNTSVRENQAGSTGGGVYATGTIDISFNKQATFPSAIADNLAVNGAGVYIFSARANFQGLDVKNGHAGKAAGGVAIVNSSVEWSNVLIQGNEALEGGGVMLSSSHVTCKGPVLLAENRAEFGGAVWVNSGNMIGSVGTHCLSNIATKTGGAFFITGNTSLENVKQELNDAPRGGCLASKSATLSLVGIEITKCSASTTGGGMLLDDSHVTTDKVSVLSSTAPIGGGLFAIESTVRGNMTIESCSGANYGGGMYLSGTTTVVGVSVRDCDAKDGGAAYVMDSNLLMEKTQLTNSYASDKGGGLYAVNSKLQLDTFYMLEDHSDSFGGGIYLEKSTVEHEGMSIERCDANIGGGLYLNESDFLALTSSSYSHISENTAVDAGGNVFLDGLCLVEQLAVSLGKADSAGGIAVDSGTAAATIERCSIVNNSAAFGGGVDIQSDSTCFLIDSNVSMNVAEETGGGINIGDATLWHDGLSMLSNVAPVGAGIFATGVSSILQQSDSSAKALLQGNNATTSATSKGYGGGIYVAPSSQVEATGLAFLDGEAYRGAGIYVDGATIILSDSLFQNGNASSGGGIYASYTSTLELANCSFIENNASQSGGAIGSGGFQGGSNTLVMNNCSIIANSAGIGGGIMLSLTNVNGSNNVLTENIAKSGGAIAMLSEGSLLLNTWSFINNTVVKNEVGVQGGTLYITNGVVTIIDSQIVSNEKATLALSGGLIYVENADTSLVIVDSLLEFGQAYSGGLIYSVNAEVSISNSTLHRGFSYDFGAGIFAVNTLLEITDCFFYDNFAFYDGGGIYMKDGGQLTVRDSFFDLNAVQDRGGAIFLSPGGAIQSTVSASNFTRNTNVGFGSTMYVGRKNTAQLTGCIISGNGGTDTEGGALSVVDAAVSIDNCLFEFNTATKGAAIQISRSATVAVRQTNIRNNSATNQGGALHATIRAVATLTDSTIDGNDAGEGGAIYAMGSAAITLASTTLKGNTASSFGGAISIRGSAELTVDGSSFERNEAYTGGALSVQGNASLSVKDSQFHDNRAVDFGAGIYTDKDTTTKTQTVGCKASRFGGNVAAAGDDIYWVYYPWFTFNCVDCTAPAGGEMILISTSAMAITPGWWPSSVTSGLSLGIDVSTSTNSSPVSAVTSSRRLISSSSLSQGAADTAATLNSSLTKPGSNVLWPTVVVRDYYGAIASYDNMTRCLASLSTEEEVSFSFSPATWIFVDEGYIVFEGAEVLSHSRDEPYRLNISCTLSPFLQTPIVVNVTVDKCNPGYENVNGLCLPCEKDTYSLDGEKCYMCPPGATCEKKDESGTTTGVISPRRQEGYFVSKTRSTYAASSCNDPSSWSADDPCKSIDEANLPALIHQCASQNSETFSMYWSRSRIYSCLSGNEYYACDTNAACVEETVFVSTASAQSSGQCAVGYSGVMCAICSDGFYKASSGLCKHCSDPEDPTLARMTLMLAMLPMVVATAALVVLCYLFSNTAEQRVVSHAQAAKRFQIYTDQSRPQAIYQATKAGIQRRARSMMQKVAERTRFRRQVHSHLFQIEPRAVEVLALRPEKFKIMVGFFQIVGSFKEVYEIPWPNSMSRLMDIFSLADFNFVDTTAAECLFKRDYFSNYRLALLALLGMLLLVFLVTSWGILRYRVKLSTLPRHCVNCGLPVFTLQHRSPPVLERRKSLVAKLKTEQKMRRASISERKLCWIDRVKSRIGISSQHSVATRTSRNIMRIGARILNRVDRLTRLPASLSTHSPRCPTSQRITNEVLDMVVHSNLRLWRARVWMRLYYNAYQNRCIKLFFWVLLLFYPMLCQRVIGTFYCDEVGDHFYLSFDRSNLCYESTWLYYLPLSIALIIVWVVGVPLLFWVIIALKRSRGVSDTLLLIQHPSEEALKQSLLLKMRLDLIDRGEIVEEEKLHLFETEMLAQYLRDRNLNDPSTAAQVGFIYHSYSTSFWWFEVWDLGRKLLLNCIISLLAKNGANRTICGLVVLLVYLSVMLFYQPFREPSDSALAGVTHIQLFITLFCGLILEMGSLYLNERVVRFITHAAITTNIMTLVFAVFSILNEKRSAVKKAQRQSREDHRRAVANHVRRLWRKAYGYALTEVYLSNPDAGPMPLLVMTELARREKYQQAMDELNAQVDLTSAINPPPPADYQQDVMLSASQVDVLDDEVAAPDEAAELTSAINPPLSEEMTDTALSA